MIYPTLDQVAAASQFELGRWMRHLASPGQSAAGRPNFNEVFDQELEIFEQINSRFEGWNSKLSKAVGW